MSRDNSEPYARITAGVRHCTGRRLRRAWSSSPRRLDREGLLLFVRTPPGCLALVSALEPIVQRISELTIEIRHMLDQHPDGKTFRSLFIAHDSWLCAATMIAEIGDCRERYPTYRALAADAGQAPVAVEYGQEPKHAQFRWACDHRLRPSALHTGRRKPPA